MNSGQELKACRHGTGGGARDSRQLQLLVPSCSHKQQIMDLSATAAIAKYHRLSDLAGIYFLTLLDAGSPRPRCWQCWFFLRLIVFLVFIWSSFHACLCPNPLSSSHLALRPTLMTSFNLTTSLKAPFSNTISF